MSLVANKVRNCPPFNELKHLPQRRLKVTDRGIWVLMETKDIPDASRDSLAFPTKLLESLFNIVLQHIAHIQEHLYRKRDPEDVFLLIHNLSKTPDQFMLGLYG